MKEIFKKLVDAVTPKDADDFSAYPFPFRRIETSDATIKEMNAMLDWHAGTMLDGRLVGKMGVQPNKRTEPQAIPDRRIVMLNDILNLRNKSVLEVGCFEGIHTLGLRLFSQNVTAIDIRPANVAKTLARLSLYGCDAKVHVQDVEKLSPSFGAFDVIFHCGVLYHLLNPVEHIQALGLLCTHVFMDTHVADPARKIEERRAGDFSYQGMYYGEHGWADPFSGKDNRSFWLSLDSLKASLARAGFDDVKVLEERAERNGPRVAILASRTK